MTPSTPSRDNARDRATVVAVQCVPAPTITFIRPFATATARRDADMTDVQKGFRDKDLQLRELQHRVAQKFQPLVVRQSLPLLVPERCVRQRLPQQLAIGKGMAQASLKIIQVRTHA